MICPDYDIYQKTVRNNLDNYLYYYTGGDTLFKILGNLSIKVSRYNSVNDLDEANLNCLGRDWPEQFRLRPFIYKKCCFVSFVRNINPDGRIVLGTERPRMWAQYADNNNGACIILNKHKLLKHIAQISEIEYSDLKNIDYKWNKNVSKEKTEEIIEFCQDASEVDILKKYSQEMLLTKHKDWEQESETRLWIIGNLPNDYLSIDGCIEGICLGYYFLEDSERVLRFVEFLTDPHYKFWGKIKLDTFGLIALTDGGYDSCSIKLNFQLPIKIASMTNSFTRLINENYPLLNK